MSSKKDVATVGDSTTANTLPALAGQFEQDVGMGFENADASSYAIPFLRILQGLSPQLKKQEAAYVKGAEEGMIVDTVTQSLYDGEKGVLVVPVHYRHTVTVWKRREDGGGFLGEISPNDPLVRQTTRDQKNRDILPDGRQLVDSRVHYVLVLNDNGAVTWAVVTMASTQTKKSKNWMARMQAIRLPRADGSVYTPPMFSHMYRLRTVPEKNNEGSWYGWAIDTVGVVDRMEIVEAAKKFRDALNSGTHKEDFATAEDSASATQGGDTDGVSY